MIGHYNRNVAGFLLHVEHAFRQDQPIPRPENRHEWRALTVHFPDAARKIHDQHQRRQQLDSWLAVLDRQDDVLQVRYRRLIRVVGFLIEESVYREMFTGEDTTRIEHRLSRLNAKLQRQREAAGNVRTLTGLALWVYRNPSRAVEVGVAW